VSIDEDEGGGPAGHACVLETLCLLALDRGSNAIADPVDCTVLLCGLLEDGLLDAEPLVDSGSRSFEAAARFLDTAFSLTSDPPLRHLKVKGRVSFMNFLKTSALMVVIACPFNSKISSPSRNPSCSAQVPLSNFDMTQDSGGLDLNDMPIFVTSRLAIFSNKCGDGAAFKGAVECAASLDELGLMSTFSLHSSLTSKLMCEPEAVDGCDAAAAFAAFNSDSNAFILSCNSMFSSRILSNSSTSVQSL